MYYSLLSTLSNQDSWISSAADCSHSKKNIVAWTAGPFPSCRKGLLSFFQVTNESSVMTSSSYKVLKNVRSISKKRIIENKCQHRCSTVHRHVSRFILRNAESGFSFHKYLLAGLLCWTYKVWRANRTSSSSSRPWLLSRYLCKIFFLPFNLLVQQSGPSSSSMT